MTKMSTWGMPRRQRPTKDAPTRRNALGTCWERVSQRSPNGATRPGSYRDTGDEPGGTGGIETSEYPEEKTGGPE